MKIIRVLCVLGIVLGLAISVLPVSASVSLHEYVNTGGDGDSNQIYGGEWVAEIFTSEASSHTVSYIKVELKRVGSPSTVRVSLKAVAAGVPTGVTLTTASLNGTAMSTSYTFYEFDVADYSLLPSTNYAIIVSVDGGATGADYIMWHKDSGGDGVAATFGLHSHDSGVAWTSDTPTDYLFEVYGDVVMQVVGGNVFTNYISTGDWLVVADVINVYPNYYGVKDPERYFHVQLLDLASNVIAATTLKSWSESPCSIYLSASMVSALTWGSAYQIRMIGTFTGTPSVTYTLQNVATAVDWVGSNLGYLDNWCIETAKRMNTYDGNTTTKPYTDTNSVGGEIITNEGGGKFIIGIPNIMDIRPDLFETSTTQPQYDKGTANNTYDNFVTWQDQVGSLIAGDATVFGNVFGITGKRFLAMGIWVIYIMTILFIFASSKGSEAIFAMAICVPLLLIGLHFRLIEAYILGIMAVIAVMFFVVKLWFTK